MKNIFIMGDSYSTYEGHIPVGYHFYYSDGRREKPIVKGAENTWWGLLAKENDLNVVMNDSFSGSTVCNTVREGLSVKSSFISRMDTYIEQNFFIKNNVDTVLIFGGTNDSWIDAPVGDLKYSDWTADDLKCVLPAFCYLIDKAKKAAENIIVIVNSELKEAITCGFIEACEKSKVCCLHLKDIDKENGHPTELGMQQIAKQAAKCLHRLS